MSVADIMRSQVHTIEASASLKDASDKMHRFDIRHLPVMQNGSLVGILSDRDLALVAVFTKEDQQLDNLWLRDVRVEKIMTEHPVVLSPRDSIQDAMKIAIHKKFGAFPVMRDQELVGIITTIDLLQAALETMQQELSS
jgi:acetoin utilization protein AcuB